MLKLPRNSFHRVALLLGGLLALYLAQIRHGDWGADFWEHSAALAALMRDWRNPGHPLLPVDAPHYFFSPYTLFLSFMARFTGVDAVRVLAAAGVANGVLLVFGVRQFIHALGFPRLRAVLFYVLWMWLFLWGAGAWQYSGFLHFGAIFLVLPYPSTFAIALSLLIISRSIRTLRISADRNGPASDGIARRFSGTVSHAGQVLLLLLLSAVVLLSHPLTFIFLATGLFAFGLDGLPRDMRAPFRAVLIIAAAAGIALAWPWYPVGNLIFGAHDVACDFSPLNTVMYETLLQRTWPIWLFLPLLCAGTVRLRRRPLLVMAILLGTIYGYGFLSGRQIYGRSLSYLLLLLQLLLGERLAALETEMGSREFPLRRRMSAGIMLGLVLATGLFASRHTVINRLALLADSTAPVHRSLEDVIPFLPPDAVVWSDPLTVSMLPAFGRRVAYARFPQSFVPDAAVRLREARRLSAGTMDAESWREILMRWQVSHVLVRRGRTVEPPLDILSEASIVLEMREWRIIVL